jgi:ribonuclease HII
MPRRCSFKLELDYPQPLAGVDEAGCAPLAGPVVAAACILDRNKFPRGIDDSKNLPIDKREAIYARLVKCAAWGVGIASVEEIDSINIYWARMLAMTRAVVGPRRRQRDSALAAAFQGDRRRRREMPVDRGRLDHRQGHARPDDGGVRARMARLRVGP